MNITDKINRLLYEDTNFRLGDYVELVDDMDFSTGEDSSEKINRGTKGTITKIKDTDIWIDIENFGEVRIEKDDIIKI